MPISVICLHLEFVRETSVPGGGLLQTIKARPTSEKVVLIGHSTTTLQFNLSSVGHRTRVKKETSRPNSMKVEHFTTRSMKVCNKSECWMHGDHW